MRIIDVMCMEVNAFENNYYVRRVKDTNGLNELMFEK